MDIFFNPNMQPWLICVWLLLYVRALVHGAVISAFLTIAQAMTDQGCV